jgi:hypothetical protein
VSTQADLLLFLGVTGHEPKVIPVESRVVVP